MTRSERYQKLRMELVKILTEHPRLANVVEGSVVAQRLHELSEEMDSIHSEALLELERDFTAADVG